MNERVIGQQFSGTPAILFCANDVDVGDFFYAAVVSLATYHDCRTG